MLTERKRPTFLRQVWVSLYHDRNNKQWLKRDKDINVEALQITIVRAPIQGLCSQISHRPLIWYILLCVLSSTWHLHSPVSLILTFNMNTVGTMTIVKNHIYISILIKRWFRFYTQYLNKTTSTFLPSSKSQPYYVY